MKICYIFSGIDKGKITGQPAVALRLVEEAEKFGYKTHIISNYTSESEYFYVNGEDRLLLKGPSTLQTYLFNTEKIIRYIKKIKPDVLHAKGILLLIYVWFINMLFLRLPIVFSLFETPERFSGFLKRHLTFCINRSDVTFTSSEYIRQVIIDNGAQRENIIVKYTGLKDKFLKTTERLYEESDILFFGDSTKERGFDIFYKLAKKLPNLKFRILLRWCGEDSREELEEVKKLRNVTVWHYPYSESLERLTLKSKIVVLPFRYMGMRPPISLLEVMALGRAVITSDMGGNEEFIKDGENGLIFNFKNTQKVINKISTLIENSSSRQKIGEEARRTILKMYSDDAYGKIFGYYSFVKENFYEKRMFGSIGGRHISKKEINLLLDLVAPKHNENILDVGTGSGRFAREIVKVSDALVVGVDPDKKILEEGKVLRKIFLTNGEDKRYKCVLGDGHNLPFTDNKFDKVFSFRTLKYYKNPWKGIDEMIRVLKPGGELVLEITSNLSWESIFNPLFSMINKKRKVMHYWEENMSNFDPKRVKEYLLTKKMIVVKEKALHKVPPSIYTIFNNHLINYALNMLDRLLLLVTPKYLFSKSMVLKFAKEK